jgi:site-specific recombinase XerD
MENEELEAKDGVSEIGMYLGYWYIRKFCWSGPAAIKENAVSLKKFYQFMLEKGEISKDDFDELKLTIKEEMPEWIATMKRYLDEDIEDMDEVWGF